jgi:hypothetical protein
VTAGLGGRAVAPPRPGCGRRHAAGASKCATAKPIPTALRAMQGPTHGVAEAERVELGGRDGAVAVCVGRREEPLR